MNIVTIRDNNKNPVIINMEYFISAAAAIGHPNNYEIKMCTPPKGFTSVYVETTKEEIEKLSCLDDVNV